MTKKLQVYETPEITVSFDPNVCKHTGVCLRTLPAVFDVRRARWIRPELEPADQVAAAVQKCPSGALQFYRNVTRNPSAAALLARRVLLNHVVVTMNGPGTLEERASAISNAIASARGYDFVGLFDVRATEIVAVGWSGKAVPANPRFALGAGLCGAAVRDRKTIVVNDVTTDARYIVTSEAVRSEMIVPVIEPASRDVPGTIDVAANRADAFTDEDRELMEDVSRAILEFWTERS